MLANVTEEYAFRVADRALPPDPRDIVRPDKRLLFALGPLLGLTFGAFVALLGPRARVLERS
jgi:LPS O-antigen subunit length determinant protein (WzzB/FepE family)